MVYRDLRFRGHTKYSHLRQVKEESKWEGQQLAAKGIYTVFTQLVCHMNNLIGFLSSATMLASFSLFGFDRLNR